jgi:hypothetical protein
MTFMLHVLQQFGSHNKVALTHSCDLWRSCDVAMILA